jgi:aubergine-like protein
VPGTAVDSGITRRHRYRDFFLVSQTAKEGTVSPTHFVIVEDTSSFRIDEVQMLAYRMTYMYYNWTGSIRIPAATQVRFSLSIALIFIHSSILQ